MKPTNIRPRFYLDNKKKEMTLIIMSFKYLPGERPFRYSTGYTIDPAEWDNKRQCPKDSVGFRWLNDELKKISDAALDVYGEMLEGRPYDHKGFKEEMDYKLGYRTREEIKTPKTIKEFVLWHLQQKANDRDRAYSKRYLDGLKVSARYLFELLSKKGYTFETIGKRFWIDFRAHIMEKGNSRNYINKKTKQVSQFFQAAEIEELLQYTKSKQPPALEDEEIYFELLTEKEVEKLAAIELKGFQQKCRDLFLIGCYTSLRVSDYRLLTKENIKETKAGLSLSVKTQKTKKTVLIPVDDKLMGILNRHGGGAPLSEKGKPISDVKINAGIKEVARKAGITQMVEKTRTVSVKGKWQTITETIPKCETISTHDGRRYWATFWYRQGIPAARLMLVTGHSKESTFMRYINIDKEENADALHLMMKESRQRKLKAI